MAVRIRMKRMGRRHLSVFRLAAVDQRSSRDGRVIEELGSFDPNQKDADQQCKLKEDRIQYWLGVGAQPSKTVYDLLKRSGIKAPCK
jgi:small subunit ribosomal protein S16